KTIGRFELVGIPPAPRGVPQIEVTFDIDANGILNVSAKDLGTGKEQSIRITASSGLSEEEIEKMVKDAESHASEDKKKRELIEARNQADGLVYTTEKAIKEHGDKIGEDDRKKIETALDDLKKAIEGSDAEEIKSKTEALATASHKLAEAMYQQTQEEANESGDSQPSAKPSDDVVDAEFEEVDDQKKE
ncbi:MAG: Hsp70 family protein, partial [Deltaproteobacteria bacterium]|nr:Hsp70 family protein [Deltaproteobacteria bacterium]